MDAKLATDVMLVTMCFAVASLISNLIVITSSRRQKRNWVEASKRYDEEIAGLSRDLDTVSQQGGEQVRRIAWLESRVRNVIPAKSSTENSQGKITITERRHRVLSLARRGQDIDTIARTLGMNHGEVELMINLGKAA